MVECHGDHWMPTTNWTYANANQNTPGHVERVKNWNKVDRIQSEGTMCYQAHDEPGFRMGTSSLVIPADTILLSFRARSSLRSSALVFPSRSMTCKRESGCSRTPILPRPLGSMRLSTFGPFVTHASATTSFFSWRPFSLVAWSFATASMLLMRLLARFSLNCICRMARSTGLPAICRPSMFSLRCEILKLAVEYLCSVYFLDKSAPGADPPSSVAVGRYSKTLKCPFSTWSLRAAASSSSVICLRTFIPKFCRIQPNGPLEACRRGSQNIRELDAIGEAFRMADRQPAWRRPAPKACIVC